jgi:hypothetical protein
MLGDFFQTIYPAANIDLSLRTAYSIYLYEERLCKCLLNESLNKNPHFLLIAPLNSKVISMSSRSLRSAAFILSLIGGIVILGGSLIAFLLSSFGSPYGTYYRMGPGMMGGFSFGYGYSGWFIGLLIVSLVCGVIVLIGAIMLNTHPTQNLTWGIIILVFSIASFIGMGGYFIGAVLSIADGAVALSY